ncbi:DUF1501 domain-containing protein [Angustibacter luteus]|uniref:DUF1501 domain-containing protein n=1 Tax=Angustibacter luteus TaxID=658456 RepID=A0ABW1JAY0_9ACTN
MNQSELPSTDCSGCEEGRRAHRLSRRSLLTGVLGVGAALAVSEHLTVRYADASTSAGTDVLLVMFLRGGFDGLSAVVPVGDPDYYKARPSIAVPQASTIALDSRFGLHPALSALKPFWDNGTFGVVHAAGMTSPNRSHFSAMEEIERAAAGSSIRTGWLDRTLGLHPEPVAQAPFRATTIGGRSPRSLAGPNPEVSMRSIADFALSGASSSADRARWSAALTQLHASATPTVGDPARSTVAGLASAADLANDGYQPANGASYPNSDLGKAFKDAAHLIKSPQAVAVLTIDEGDWDMHAGLGTVGKGWMHDKLADLGGSLAAFGTDLGDDLARVTLVTMSEFGRRTSENASNGVDHGWGNAMLMFGGGVQGGQVHGTWPGLSADNLVQGDLRATTDYRAVLADVLVNRCGATLDEARTVFPGWTGTPLGTTKPAG